MFYDKLILPLKTSPSDETYLSKHSRGVTNKKSDYNKCPEWLKFCTRRQIGTVEKANQYGIEHSMVKLLTKSLYLQIIVVLEFG